MAKRPKKKKPARAAGAKQAPAKRKKAAKRPARKAKKIKMAKKHRVSTKRPAKKKTRKIIGEGNYAAARTFDREEQAFVRANKARIPQLGKEAEAALEGPEGAELTRAEESARGHTHE